MSTSTQRLDADGFGEFFSQVHGVEPWPWQQRLVSHVIEAGAFPPIIEAPASAGKTAVIDIALFALAARPDAMPRRIAFASDQRTVADCALTHVSRLRAALGDPDANSATKDVAYIFHGLSGGTPLNGSDADGRFGGSWPDRPDVPWVTVSTVDALSSALLMRAGGGTHPRMRPVRAGLAANDCLVVLNDVSLASAFAGTLEAVAACGGSKPLDRRFEIVRLQSTARADKQGPADKFGLDSTDRANPALAQIIDAPKTIQTRRIKWVDAHRDVPPAVRDLFDGLDDHERCVGVVVNSIRTARHTSELLVGTLGADWEVHLVTGRMRPLDAGAAVARVSGLVDPARDHGTGKRTVVVATQSIETGSDFSFDALISEVAPIPSLRQRLGRLDRRGQLAARNATPARAWVLGPEAPSEAHGFADHPVYGTSAASTWEELKRRTRHGREPLTITPADADDFPAEAHPERLRAPLLLPSHLDAWRQTNPAPVVDPPVEPFAHGVSGDRRTYRPSDVQIMWRHDRSRAALNAVPPRAAEQISVPYAAAVAWLGSAASARVEVGVADAGQPATWANVMGLIEESAVADSQWCRWRGHDTAPESVRIDEIQPGDLLIVDPSRGGLSQGSWDPHAATEVADLGDAAQTESGERFTLRLDSRLWPCSMPEPPSPSPDIEADRTRIVGWLEQAADHEGASDRIRTAANRLAAEHSMHRIGDAYYVLCNTTGLDAADMDGSDQANAATGVAVTLADHLDGVGDRARAYAERLGFSRALVDDIELAARLHDVGKADPQYQRALLGGDDVALAMLDTPLAKSPPGVRPDPAAWPPIRHEFVSVLLAEASDQIAAAHDPDLVLHLIGSHHGGGRALPMLRTDPDPREVHYGTLSASTADADAAMPDRMVARFAKLHRLYGPFGLAWIESVLRLADHQQSAAEQRAP